MEITRQEYEAIINNGNDINISKISGCSSTSMDQCEQCPDILPRLKPWGFPLIFL